MVLWGWQGFIFGYLNIRFFSFFYLAIFLFLFLKTFKFEKINLKKIKIDKLLVLIMAVGVFLQVVGVFFMGARFPDAITICCGVTPDNNLELSIVNEIMQRFPPFEPGWYGHPLVNYHYWSHLIFAELIRVFNLPLVATVYQYSTVLFSFLFGLALIAISRMLKMKREYTLWLLFFSYFGGDFAYLISIFQGKGFGFAIGAMEHSAQLFLNYPRAMSIVVFLSGLILFLQWVKDRKLFTGILMAIVLGSVIGFKVYTGIFVLIGCVSYGAYLLFKKRLSQTIPLFITAALSLIIYLPVNSGAGGLFYTGFWRVNDFIVLPGLQLSHLELAREIYEKGGNWLRVLSYELLFTALYLFITFGTKILGIFQTKKSLKNFPVDVHIFLLPGFFASFILGIFYYQHIGGPNTFNFLVTILILGCLYTSLGVYYWLNKTPKIFHFVFALILILTTIPRVIFYSTEVYQKFIHTEKITLEEQSALSFMKDNTPKFSIYLADPFIDAGLTHYSEYVSPYIPYMTQRLSFLSGVNDEMEAHGIEHKERLSLAKEVYTSTNSGRVEKILGENNISYLYMPSFVFLPVATTSSKLKVVFDNGSFRIYKVNLP